MTNETALERCCAARGAVAIYGSSRVNARGQCGGFKP